MIASLFGLALAAMQSTGSDPVVLAVTAPCTYMLDGKAATLDEIGARVAEWQRSQPEIELKPDPQSSFECVEPPVKLLVRSDLTRIGFVGIGPAGDEQ